MEGIEDLTEKELDAELEKGYKDFKRGNVKTAEQVFTSMREDYGI